MFECANFNLSVILQELDQKDEAPYTVAQKFTSCRQILRSILQPKISFHNS